MGKIKGDLSITKKRTEEEKEKIKQQLTYYMLNIYEGSLTMVKQDGYIVQFNISEKYTLGDYLC